VHLSLELMGLPMDARAAIPPDDQLNAEFFDAAMRLQGESYNSFAQRLNVNSGQDGSTEASVAEELRRLQIDPEIFYRNAERLRVSDYCPEDLDPTGRPSCRSSGLTPLAPPTPATLAALLASDGDSALEVMEAPASSATCSSKTFEPPARGSHSAQAEHLDALRAKETESYHIETDADNRCRLGNCGLHVPEDERAQDPVCEEIVLDAEEEEQTLGGRMNSKTPCGLEAKLQIDSLTDDEDDEFFQTTSANAQARAPDEEDEIEAFTLDPDFDYDKVDNLTRRL